MDSPTSPACSPILRRFRHMQEASNFADSIHTLGLFVSLKDNAVGLSGAAYERATKEYRFEVTARPIQKGDGVTILHYSDAEAFTVIGRTRCTLTIQRDKAKLLNPIGSDHPSALVCTPGGFAGHVSGTQLYSYEADPKGVVEIARLTKRGWAVRGERVVSGRHEHYDFNF